MKKIVLIFILIFSFSILTSCNTHHEPDASKFKKSIYNGNQQSKNVTLSIKDKIVTQGNENITIMYTNLSQREYFYGEEPLLEVSIKGEWYVVPILENTMWHDIVYIIQPKSYREDSFPIKYYYGKLTKNSYRVVKLISSNDEKEFVIAEFNIQ